MLKKIRGLIAAGLISTAVISCAGTQQLVTITPTKGETVLAMRADSFKFEPNNLKAVKGQAVILQIENVSNSGHNFTITDPQGRTLQSVALPPKETVKVSVELSEAGVYEFYCDKPLHPAFGMKGKIEVAPAQ